MSERKPRRQLFPNPRDLERYIRDRKDSGSFRVTIESPPPSDPCTRLAQLAQSTAALHERCLLQDELNTRLDDVIDRNRIREQARRENGR